MLAGPGKYSLDRALGIRLPRWTTLIGLVVISTIVYFAAKMEPPTQQGAEGARDELQAEDEGGIHPRIPRAVVSPPPEVGTNRHGRFGGKYVMDPQWLRWVKRLQAIAQDGLTRATGDYDVGRYEQLREIGAEILASRSTGELEDAAPCSSSRRAPQPPR